MSIKLENGEYLQLRSILDGVIYDTKIVRTTQRCYYCEILKPCEETEFFIQDTKYNPYFNKGKFCKIIKCDGSIDKININKLIKVNIRNVKHYIRIECEDVEII